MTMISLLGLALAMLILAVTPGPGVFAVVARALASGFTQAAVMTLGVVLGDVVFILLVVFGLSALAEHLYGLFLVIKYLGAAYLIYLGFSLWFAKKEEVEVESAEEASWTSNLLTGLFITLSNPKAILFYLSFLPTFIDLTNITSLDVVLITAVAVVVVGVAMLMYAYAADKARHLFQSKKAKQVLDRTAGGVMIVSGSALALKS